MHKKDIQTVQLAVLKFSIKPTMLTRITYTRSKTNEDGLAT